MHASPRSYLVPNHLRPTSRFRRDCLGGLNHHSGDGHRWSWFVNQNRLRASVAVESSMGIDEQMIPEDIDDLAVAHDYSSDIEREDSHDFLFVYNDVEVTRWNAEKELGSDLNDIIGSVSARWPAASRGYQDMDDIKQDVWTKILQGRFTPYDELNSSLYFRGWCRRVTENFAKSSYKKFRRDHGDKDDNSLGERAALEPYANDPEELSSISWREWEFTCAVLRNELNRMRSEYKPFQPGNPRQINQVNFYAVLLIRLRLETSRLLAPFFERDAPTNGEVMAKIEESLPWTPNEQKLAFRNGMLTINEIWSSLGPLLNQEPYSMDGCQFWDALSLLSNSIDPQKKNLWDTWSVRVSKLLLNWIEQRHQAEAPEEDIDGFRRRIWETTFGPFLNYPRRKLKTSSKH